MTGVAAFLAPGLRKLDPEGRLTNEPADADALAGHEHLIVFDLEMSGPNATVHEILDIGAVHIGLAPGFPEHGSVASKVRPKRIGNAEPGALKVVGYSSKLWKDAPDLERSFPQLVGLASGRVLAGWGIGQDIAFLVEACRQLALPWPFALIALDIQPIARGLLKSTGQVDRFNLGHVADRLGIGRMGEHSALADAYAAFDVLVKLAERAEPA
ncbi:MAG: exonuclease domain-containing protein [Dehalococcoidia bacterium]